MIRADAPRSRTKDVEIAVSIHEKSIRDYPVFIIIGGAVVIAGIVVAVIVKKQRKKK